MPGCPCAFQSVGLRVGESINPPSCGRLEARFPGWEYKYTAYPGTGFKKPCKMGPFQSLTVLFVPSVLVAFVLLLAVYLFGTGFTVFRTVGAGDDSRPANGAPLHITAMEKLRFQWLVQRQNRMTEPCTADGIGNALDTDTFLPVVQQNAVAVVIVAALPAYEGVCPSALSRCHMGQGNVPACALGVLFSLSWGSSVFFVLRRFSRKPFLPPYGGVSPYWHAIPTSGQVGPKCGSWRCFPCGWYPFQTVIHLCCPSMN